MSPKQLLGLPVILLTFAVLMSCNQSGMNSGSADIESNIDSVSYSFGYLNGNSLRQQGMDDLELEALMAGLRDGLNENDPQIDNNRMSMIARRYQMQKQQEAQQERQQQAGVNKKEGEDFLAENREKEGVQVTESGLQYKVLEEGSGASPTADDTVRVHYRGMHLDGSVFDSSYERDDPTTFPVSGVIKGWTEGLQMMKEGGKYKFWIPAELGYGANPNPRSPIEPNEVLVFEVELIEVK